MFHFPSRVLCREGNKDNVALYIEAPRDVCGSTDERETAPFRISDDRVQRNALDVNNLRNFLSFPVSASFEN
jgi:hypothetical protein